MFVFYYRDLLLLIRKWIDIFERVSICVCVCVLDVESIASVQFRLFVSVYTDADRC